MYEDIKGRLSRLEQVDIGKCPQPVVYLKEGETPENHEYTDAELRYIKAGGQIVFFEGLWDTL